MNVSIVSMHCGSNNEAHNDRHGRTFVVYGRTDAEAATRALDAARAFARDCADCTMFMWNDYGVQRAGSVTVNAKDCAGFTVLAITNAQRC